MKTLALVALTAATLSFGIGAAEARDNIRIGGNANQNVQTGHVTQLTVGNLNKVDQNIGTVRGNVTVGGNLNQNVRTGHVTQLTIGNLNTASQLIGTITTR